MPEKFEKTKKVSVQFLAPSTAMELSPGPFHSVEFWRVAPWQMCPFVSRSSLGWWCRIPEKSQAESLRDTFITMSCQGYAASVYPKRHPGEDLDLLGALGSCKVR